ncbi:hypothetical protein KP509_17G083600 [Ceratopteris richardii]|uniref:Uncharacterized protein n=1 Tax=Ceratopteris richardii TaxID=49495 RepID=A0A8T2SW44_CERRI|nr:hypothetical protein KP509_17G083600 [Ceratopteris richardii]KAH7374014.1 hypothetical protein KP509_17G083600 [Ceratopteris richardii]
MSIMNLHANMVVVVTELVVAYFLIRVPVLGSGRSCFSGQCQLNDECSVDTDCSRGLFCSSCDADNSTSSSCHRYQATNVTAIKGGLPFNRYSWLTTHNSFSIVGEPMLTGPRFTFYNQQDSITNQLNRPAIYTLKEIESFLAANPSEVVSIFIEDYVSSRNGLTNLFAAAGLRKYWFPVSSMPKDGGDWPTLTEMISKNHRLLVFTSNSTKEANEGIAYNWRYILENHSGDGGMFGNCSNRDESEALNSRNRSLFLINYFPTFPNQDKACIYNSAPLLKMLSLCYNAAGRRWPNFVAVNFYKQSDGSGVFGALDTINGGLICGCSDIASCKLHLSYGTCPNVKNASTTTIGRHPNVQSSTVMSPPYAHADENSKSRGFRHRYCHLHFEVLILLLFVTSFRRPIL